MTLNKDIMPYFDKFIHVYGSNLSILGSFKIWTPKKFWFGNCGHPVSKSWLRPCPKLPGSRCKRFDTHGIRPTWLCRACSVWRNNAPCRVSQMQGSPGWFSVLSCNRLKRHGNLSCWMLCMLYRARMGYCLVTGRKIIPIRSYPKYVYRQICLIRSIPDWCGP